MSNIDKQALRLTAEKAQEHGVFNMDIHSQTVMVLLDELEAKERRITEQAEIIAKQEKWIKDVEATMIAATDRAEAAEKRIAELEAKLETADKLQDSAFRHGLQHGFSLGQTDNQAGFEECLLAYSHKEKSNG